MYFREEIKSLKLQLTAAKKEAEEEQSKVDLITRQLTEERESEQHKVASLEADLYVTKNLNAALNGRLQDQGWKFMSCSHVKSCVNLLSWLLIGCSLLCSQS